MISFSQRKVQIIPYSVRAKQEMSEVSQLESAIRNIFNIPRRYRTSLNNRDAFNQTCSALDTIGDTELAFDEYIELSDTFSKGITYVLVYGLLQAIFVQQDAIKHLACSLELQFKLPDELKEIRDQRNDAIGHPTQRDIDNKKRIRSFHQISRNSLSIHCFQQVLTLVSRSLTRQFQPV